MALGTESERKRLRLVVWGMAALALAVHIAVNLSGGYGLFRDELYFVACSENLSAGYVDHPPLSVLLLKLWRLLFGSSLFAIRFPIALAAAGTVALAGLITRELGGGTRAAFFACLAVLVSPVHLGITNIFSMNGFDILAWAAATCVLLTLIRDPRPSRWLLLGMLLGLGLLNKTSVLWLGAGIAVAMILIAPLRRQLRTVWPYLAAAIALSLFSPFLIWNAVHGFPHLEFMRNALMKYRSQTPGTFLTGVLLAHHPLTAPFWLGGLLFLAFGRPSPTWKSDVPGSDHETRRSQMRALFVIFSTVVVILLLNYHSKPEYLTAGMVLVFAGGGLAVERVLAGRWGRALAAAYAVVLILTGMFVAPMALPVLPVNSYIAYSRALGMAPATAEGHQLSDLPQFYADMFGWKEKARDVARVFDSLSAAEKAKCAIFAQNYGQCGAIDYFGEKYGLPPSIGGHNSYWTWGPRGHTGELVIVLGGDMEDLEKVFESVERAGISACDHCIPYEDNVPIYICRRAKKPLGEIWAKTKHYS